MAKRAAAVTNEDLAGQLTELERMARSELRKMQRRLEATRSRPGVAEVASGRMTLEEWLEARGAKPRTLDELAAPELFEGEDLSAFLAAAKRR